MIKIDTISDNVLRITAPEKLKADDFRQIAPEVDSIISRYGKIRLLIDASGFNGWENITAFENHAGFVKNHERKVDRIAVIVWCGQGIFAPRGKGLRQESRKRSTAMDR